MNKDDKVIFLNPAGNDIRAQELVALELRKLLEEKHRKMEEVEKREAGPKPPSSGRG
jgi:hypothetical protein